MPVLRKVAIKINFYFSRFSKATSGKIYVTLFNFRAILSRQEVRFNFKKEGGYIATERQYFRYFVEEEQNWNTYSRGLISRSQRIGRDYFLDRILFSKDDLICIFIVLLTPPSNTTLLRVVLFSSESAIICALA